MADTDTKDTAQTSTLDLLSDEFLSPGIDPDAQRDQLAPPANDELEDGGDGGDGEPASGVNEDGEYVREIDLGEGSGKQVFKAKTAEEMVEKLYKAQENASKKIREQAAQLRRRTRVEPERHVEAAPAELTADQIFAIQQEFAKNPVAALDKILAAKGIDLSELKQDSIELRTQKMEHAFLQKHEGVDYFPTPKNAQAIQSFLREEKLSYTAKNLEYAFQELTDSGLLEVAAEVKKVKDGESKTEEERIVVPEHTRRKPMNTGLSSKQSSSREVVPAAKVTKGISESEVEDLYNLPTEQAREKMLKYMARASSSR